MAKPKILVVDNDIKSQRILEVSLRKEGYTVTTAVNGMDAQEKITAGLPDLIISDTKMPEMDGFEFCSRLKADNQTSQIPFIFLTWQKTLQDKVRGLEMGVEDYLTKPIYVKEILTRVKLLLEKRDKEQIEKREGKAQFSGELSEMALVDLIQTVEIGRKSGVIVIDGGTGTGQIFFRDGKVIDAEFGRYSGERAVYRMLMLSKGSFSIQFQDVDREERIGLSSQGLLMEGMRRVDEWERLTGELPQLDQVFEADAERVEQHQEILPAEVREILGLMDGKRTLTQVVDDSELDEISALSILGKLYFEAFLRPAGDASAPVLAEPTVADSEPAPADAVAEPSPTMDAPESEPEPEPPADDAGEDAGADAADKPAVERPAALQGLPGTRRPSREISVARRPEEKGGKGLVVMAVIVAAVVVYFVAIRDDGKDLTDETPVVGVADADHPVVGAPPRIVEVDDTGLPPDVDTAGTTGDTEGTDLAADTGSGADSGSTADTGEAMPAPPPLAPIAPEDLRPKPQAPLELYRGHVKTGQTLYDQGKLNLAVAEYKEALDIFPRGVAAYRALGNIYNELDQNQTALSYLKRGLRIAPRDAGLHLNLGTVYQTLGKQTEAKRSYERYLALKPNGRFADDVRAILRDIE